MTDTSRSDSALRRVAVITAVAGGKDALVAPSVEPDGADFIAFVDEPQPHVTRWTQRALPTWSTDPYFSARRNAKVPKVMPWLLAPGYEYYIWVDANFTLKQSPAAICDQMFTDQATDLAVFRHPWRSCVYDEAAVIVQLALDDPTLVHAQMAEYRRVGHPPNGGLFASCMVAWRVSRGSERLSLAWWSHICRFSSRDQLSLPVAVRAVGCTVKLIDGTSHLDNPFIEKVAVHRIPSACAQLAQPAPDASESGP